MFQYQHQTPKQGTKELNRKVPDLTYLHFFPLIFGIFFQQWGISPVSPPSAANAPLKTAHAGVATGARSANSGLLLDQAILPPFSHPTQQQPSAALVKQHILLLPQGAHPRLPRYPAPRALHIPTCAWQ